MSHRRRRRSLQVAGCPAWSSSTSTQSQATCRGADYSAIWRQTLKNLAAPGVRRLLNRVKQLVAIDGHIEVWADGLSFANAFSHPRVQAAIEGLALERPP
ncbi:MAG: hypothetical protein QOJ51_6388, partial [Acidobacteriaceae bacterium]|nr:hypothetical protein [Acidobacteriaceae bacterium]